MTRSAGAGEQESYYDKELLREMAQRVASSGFVPADVLKEEFGPTRFTQGVAILFRQFRMFREIRRPYGEGAEHMLGYEWADRRFSKAEIKKIPMELGFLIEMGKALRPRYADFEIVKIRCRWTNHVLGALPRSDAEGPYNAFERDGEGNVLIPAYCLRGMAKAALPFVGKESTIAYKIGFQAIRVEHPDIKIVSHPIIDDRGQGLGIKRSEQLEAGVEFEIVAMVPTSVLTVSEYVRMLTLAGPFIRLSPARHTGYGDFIVIP